MPVSVYCIALIIAKIPPNGIELVQSGIERQLSAAGKSTLYSGTQWTVAYSGKQWETVGNIAKQWETGGNIGKQLETVGGKVKTVGKSGKQWGKSGKQWGKSGKQCNTIQCCLAFRAKLQFTHLVNKIDIIWYNNFA